MNQHVSIYFTFIIAMLDAMFMNFFIIVFNDLKMKLSKIMLNGLFIGMITFLLYAMQREFTEIFYILYIAIFYPVIFAVIVKYVYKIPISKSLLSVYIITTIEIILTCFIFFAFSSFNIDITKVINNETYLIIINIMLYIIKTILILVIIIYKSRVNLSLSIRSKNITFMFTFILLTALVLMANASLFCFYYKDGLNTKMMLFLLIIYMLYFGFNIILAISMTKYDKRSLEIEQQNFYDSTMSDMVRDLKVIKRKYDNTMAALKGYIQFEDWDGLEEYVNEIFMKDKSENIRNNLMLQKIKSAGLAGLIMTKFEMMNQSGINANLIVEYDINEINMNISDLCQSLGILLDNAYEAALNSEEKYVMLSIYNNDGIIKFIIENSSDKKNDIEKMFHKVGLIKGQERDLGLIMLKNTLKKYKNVLFNTIEGNNNIKMELTIS
ncbi:two-component system, AgrA family, sensor histidine kinase AgrC [Caloramator quimbayensis]|uniref:Two-component system, AgrA family, sensor histidine kinase AgrC n=1 Tax=Caloramator quimbayensis TaxID=1147123 RepID=A0A1T4X6V6_9CLOT|nr:GHKL domain-containing protein [Caloramator quimbayensis]SKA84601.1 two-component system, AgrA family, sensor histidine kinase AgrC [Caloramator quimbayensis]